METQESIIESVKNNSLEYKALDSFIKESGLPMDRLNLWVSRDEVMGTDYLSIILESHTERSIWKNRYLFDNSDLYQNQARKFVAEFFELVADEFPSVKEHLK
ncbi:hypothetical protein PANI_CDS0125 [Maribacter phage Panino]